MRVQAVPASTEGTASQSGAEELWSEEKTLFLIDAYKYLRNNLGKKMPTKRQMWESLAEKINDVFPGTVTASQVENKWRALEKRYKKLVSSSNMTGKGLQKWAFEE